MKSRNGRLSGGQSRIAATDFRLSPLPSRKAQTTPVAVPRPERDADEGSRLERRIGRRAIAVGRIDRDGDEHIDDFRHAARL